MIVVRKTVVGVEESFPILGQIPGSVMVIDPLSSYSRDRDRNTTTTLAWTTPAIIDACVQLTTWNNLIFPPRCLFTSHWLYPRIVLSSTATYVYLGFSHIFRFLLLIKPISGVASKTRIMTPDFQNNIRLPPKWIELNITKRECATFLAVPGEETLCQCGRRKADHGDFAKQQVRPETWSPSLHTRSFNTDAYGTILFEGEHHPNKAHYVRLSYDTNPEIIVQLMTYVWNLSMPKLIISLRGGSSNFEMPARLGKIFQAGLTRAARSTNAWVFSNGLNCGAAKHLGTALNNENWIGGPGKSKVVSVGITPWGIIENRSDLIGRNKDRVYSLLEHAKSKFLHLNSRHSNFLLVDNGSIGKFGAENYCRRRLEKCVSTYPTTPNRGCDIPIVVVVVEGGFYTLREISDYLYDEPPVPVVIFAGTGRAADLLTWMIRRVANEKEYDSLKEKIYQKLMHFFRIGINSCPVLYQELRNIFLRKNLITIYNPNTTTIDNDFDAVILSSIFRSQHWTPLQQLSLALIWNRVDIANAEVFIYGREWSREHLEHAMMEALVSNRLDFVNLLLEHGLNMQSFLTVRRLEALYSLDRIPSMVMRTMLVEFSKTRSSKRRHHQLNRHSGHEHHHQPHQDLTLHDIGVAMSHMMGHVYKSHYIHIVPKNRLDGGSPEDHELVDADQTFHHPFDDLFIWAVLTKRHDMSKLLWPHGISQANAYKHSRQGALSKALVAVKLNKYFANEINTAEKILTNMAIDFERYTEEWENLSLSLLDSCYRSDSQMARQLLTMELECWSKQTCLTLSVEADHRMLLGHPCCQILLADLWMGALNVKSTSPLKITLGIFFPPFALMLDYKSTEELRLLPHEEKQQSYHNLHYSPKNIENANAIEQERLLNDDIFDEEDSLHTYEAGKSGSSFTSVFRNRRPHSLRKTDLAEVTRKIGLSSTVSEAMMDTGKMDKTSSRRHHSPEFAQENYPDTPSHSVIPESFRDNGDTYTAELAHQNAQTSPLRFSSFVKTEQNLRPWDKIIEFQKAPVTNFYRHMIAYLVFIAALTYVILYPQNPKSPGWVELYLIACIVTQALDCIREFIEIDALNFTQKLCEIKNNLWQVADFILIIFFLIGVLLRFIGYYEYGMLLYRTSSIYWNLRLYKYMGAHKFIGPKILMMSRMFSHMACFAMIILVVILSFGIAREAIRFPDLNPSWRDLAEAFLEPYTMMFGEVDLDALSPQCGDEPDDDCPLGAWFIPLAWVVYMMVANILVMNVLIAVYNGIYTEIDAISVAVWMFQRFTLVMEFERKPWLPAPFIIICHIISICQYIWKKCVRCMCEESLLMEQKVSEEDNSHILGITMGMGNDHSLKSFLSGADQHMVFDFEEENIDTLRHLLYKEHDKSNGGETVFGYRSALTSEKVAFQQLKLGLDELYTEMEGQRLKLDRLLTCWEMYAQEKQVGDDDDDDDDENSDDNSKEHENQHSIAVSVDEIR